LLSISAIKLLILLVRASFTFVDGSGSPGTMITMHVEVNSCYFLFWLMLSMYLQSLSTDASGQGPSPINQRSSIDSNGTLTESRGSVCRQGSLKQCLRIQSHMISSCCQA
jgi:hypothetical protein